MCNFTPKKRKSISNSSKKDAVISFGSNKLYNLFPLIRSLRTTGSRCRFILLTTSQSLTIYPSTYYKSANLCGVEFINISSISYSKKATCVLRYLHLKDFLIKNNLEIERVIFIDLYDTIFQNDPFTTDFGDSIYFCDEGVIIKENGYNKGWVNEVLKKWKNYGINITINDDLKNEILSKNILNSGIIAGKTKYIIEFADAISMAIRVKTFRFKIIDQGFMNVLVYSGYFNGRLNYTILPLNNSLFDSIALIGQKIDEDTEKLVFGNISINGAFPAIIHQHDRSKKIISLVESVCPNIHHLPDYIRIK